MKQCANLVNINPRNPICQITASIACKVVYVGYLNGNKNSLIK